jgi:hypothetical protein
MGWPLGPWYLVLGQAQPLYEGKPGNQSLINQEMKKVNQSPNPHMSQALVDAFFSAAYPYVSCQCSWEFP